MCNLGEIMEILNIEVQGQQNIEGKPFPVVFQPREDTSYSDFLKWSSGQKEWFRKTLQEYGAIILRGFPVESSEAFEQFLDTAGFPRMPYLGGAAPREKVTPGRVLTANESPPSEPIPFHHEMAQVPNPPAYVFFFCVLPPQEGGETAIVHSNRVYKRFAAIDPDFAEKVEREGVQYIRVMPDQDDPKSPIGRSWRSTFLTDDRAVAEQKMKDLGTTWTWLENGNLRTQTATVPAIRTDSRTGMKTFFNSMVAAYTGWVDSRNDPQKAVCCGDGSAVNGDTLEKTAQAMEEEAAKIRWQRGDVMLIDNKLVLHARKPFVGPRRIVASIAPDDSAEST
ncbi:MAG: hypothetical protein CMK59_12830 [Proteobacteria bacterium]|nr:hypothetical protein [Pseudomonadota bacterium]